MGELPLSYRSLGTSAANSSLDTHLQGTILLIWSNLSLVISAMIHRLGLTLLSHHPSFLTLPLAPESASLSLAPKGSLSGNQAGRAHFNAYIIFPVIANEYELPSVGRGGVLLEGCRGVTVLRWHRNKLMSYSFKLVAQAWHSLPITCTQWPPCSVARSRLVPPPPPSGGCLS